MAEDSSSSDPRFRRLLPAASSVSSLGNELVVPKRPSVRTHVAKAACEACRKRKTKCDGERPSCARCVSRETECEYETSRPTETLTQALKRKYSELNELQTLHEKIYETLQTRPRAEAQEIFERIRAGVDPQSILRQIQEGDILLQLSLVPETRYRYEFPYVKDMPEFLQRMSNPYLNAQFYEWTREGSPKHAAGSGTVIGDGYLKPYHAAELVDPRLDLVKPSDWTTISSNNSLMRQLLASYFMYGYQWLMPFQKDYFLDDMAKNRRRLCSPLLVNAILACACSCYPAIPKRYEYWNPWSLGYQFLAEAKRLWALEVGQSRLSTIHAGLVITLVHNMACMDKIGWTYTLQAIRVAHDLRLFDPTVAVKSRTMRNARNFTAWTLFNYQSLHCYAVFDKPVLEKPPDIPLPDPSADPEWYGQIWIRYPLSSRPVSTHSGHLFYACTKVRIIMNDISLQLFNNPATSPSVTLQQVQLFQNRLKSWFDDLPAPLTPANIVCPSHFLLHLNYQTVLINLHEPFRAERAEQDQATEDLAVEASIHLETLLRLYYLRHGFVSFDPFLVHPLNVLGFSSMKKLKPTLAPADLQATRSTIILAAKGLYDQAQCHYVAQVTLRFLKTSMRPEEKGLFDQIADLKEIQDEVTQNQMSEVRARWAPSIIKVTNDPDPQRLSNLVKQYMDLNKDSESDHTSVDTP